MCILNNFYDAYVGILFLEHPANYKKNTGNERPSSPEADPSSETKGIHTVLKSAHCPVHEISQTHPRSGNSPSSSGGHILRGSDSELWTLETS